MVKLETGEKLELFRGEDGSKYELLSPLIKMTTTKASVCFPTTLVSMTSYNATISATILVRHYDGKEKGEFEIQKVDIASFWQCYTRHLCPERSLAQDAVSDRRVS
jgi:hypothetical protein